MRRSEHSYGTEARQCCTVLSSADSESDFAENVLVYIHGGLWAAGEKSQYLPIAEQMWREGWSVVVAEYRISSSSVDDDKNKLPVTIPQHSRDVQMCINFALHHTRASNLILVGHSCGAHMAALVAQHHPSVADLQISDQQTRLKLAICVQSIFSVRQFVREFPSWRGEVVLSHGEDESKWIDPDPEKCAASGTEFLLLHSPSDDWVRIEQSTLFAEAVKKAGGQVSMESDERGKHFAAVRDDAKEITKMALRIQREMKRFERPLEGRDEERRLGNAGFREGREIGSEQGAQQMFAKGFEEGSKQGLILGEKLGEWHTREQLGKGEDSRKDDLIALMEEDRQLSEKEMQPFI